MREILIAVAQNAGLAALAAAAALLLMTFVLWVAYRLGLGRDRRRWPHVDAPMPVEELGEARRLRVLPLVEWRAQPRLTGDAGLSYLVEVDGAKLLFDLGDKRGGPSPLRRNLGALGLDPAKFTAELTALVVSHNHREHAGGFWGGRRVKMDAELDFSHTPTFVPWRDAAQARRIVPGAVVSPRLFGRMFALGGIEEQMLLVNLAGKGLVCIVGDAHPEPLVMVDYAERLTGVKPYAYVGGLHALMNQEMPAPRRWMLTRRPPWRRSEPEEVGVLAVALRDMGVQKIYASGHDSDDFSLGIIATVFGENLRILSAGEMVEID